MTQRIQRQIGIGPHSPMFWAGICIGTALFGFRIAGAHTYADVLIAVALTLAEFSVVFLWERKAGQLAGSITEWKADEKLRGRVRGLCEAAAANLADRQSAIGEIDRKIEQLEEELEYDHLVSDLKSLITIATNAIRAGYYAGISANAGAVSGGEAPKDGEDDEDE